MRKDHLISSARTLRPNERKLPLTDPLKRLKIHQPIPLSIIIPQQFQNLRFLHIESQGSHRDFQFMIIYGPIFVRIEKLKGLFDLLSLVVA